MLASSTVTVMILVDSDFDTLIARWEPINGLDPKQWKRHLNPDGSIGGWVQQTANVDSTAFVGSDAIVSDFAEVTQHAIIRDFAIVSDFAEVGQNAVVRDFARISGRSVISGNAKVSENAKVTDIVRVTGACVLRGHVLVYGDGTLSAGTHCEGMIRTKAGRKRARALGPLSL